MSPDKQKFSAPPDWIRQSAPKHLKLLIALIIILLLGIYLYLAHFFIYYRLGQAHLPIVSRQDAYTLGKNPATTKSLTYVALGDSLTSGVGADSYQESYPYLLAKTLAQDKAAKIVLKNFSFPGARADQLITYQLNPAIAAQPDIITLLIGTNDVHGATDQENFQKRYDYILSRLTKETKAKIYLLGLPNTGSTKLLWLPYNFYFTARTAEFNEGIKSLAQKYKLQYIDLENPTALAAKKDLGYYSKDLFHPSALGYQLWAQIIYANISK